LARSYTPANIETLGNWSNSPETDADIRIRAIQILLDRGWGRPVSKTEVTGADGSNAIEVTIRTIVEGKK
jgi:hypothetical protein